MNFGDAIGALKAGERVARAGWTGKGMRIRLVFGFADASDRVHLPYIEMTTVDGSLLPWLASHTDILAEDWSVIGEGDAPAAVDAGGDAR